MPNTVALWPSRDVTIDTSELIGADLVERAESYARSREEVIEENPDVLGGTPVIRDTRISVYALLGRATPIGENRGQVLESPLFAPPVLVTAHPSSVLRERDSEARRQALEALADDLRIALQL